MHLKNSLSIENMDKALSAIQIAIDDLNDADEQLENFRKILFSRFGMSEYEHAFENRIKETQKSILMYKELCNDSKNYVVLAKERMIACDQIDNELSEKAKMWK